jgi:hypothetical protein
MVIPLTTVDPLGTITIATPCHVPWREMSGDHRSRHCRQCERQVYDLSAMTTAESLELFGDPTQRPCIRLYRRSDGRVMTADCPVGIRARIWRRLRRRAAWAGSLFAVLFLQSCRNYTQGLWGEPPSREPDYPLLCKDGPKQGKEVVVALFITTNPAIGPISAGTEETLSSNIAKKVPELSKESPNPQKLTVLDHQKINQFKNRNPAWESKNPAELGQKLGVDFVLTIRVEKMSLYQLDSQNRHYQGAADVKVDVYDVNAVPGQAKYSYLLPFNYPRTHPIPVDTMPQKRFEQDFFEHLATEIAIKHVMHKISSGIEENN